MYYFILYNIYLQLIYFITYDNKLNFIKHGKFRLLLSSKVLTLYFIQKLRRRHRLHILTILILKM